MHAIVNLNMKRMLKASMNFSVHPEAPLPTKSAPLRLCTPAEPCLGSVTGLQMCSNERKDTIKVGILLTPSRSGTTFDAVKYQSTGQGWAPLGLKISATKVDSIGIGQLIECLGIV